MQGKFSVSILIQSFNEADDSPRNDFEHLIVLYHLKKETSLETLVEKIKKNNYMSPYETADGSFIYGKVVKIIDIFELNDDLLFENNTEVYSRFFTDDVDLEEITKRYFSDFVLLDHI